jgi:hypothetical protein
VLTRIEIDAITPVLTQLVSRAGGRNWFIGALLPSAFLPELSIVAPQTASDDFVAAAALQICINKEWPEQPGQPCWLELVLTAVAAQGLTVVPNLTSVTIPRIQRRENILDQTWDEEWLLNDFPFFNRTELRSAVRSFAPLTGKPVLRIEGPTKVGKTYSKELFEKVSLTGAWAFRVVKVELKNGAQITMNALTLATALVQGMDCDPDTSSLPLAEPKDQNILLLKGWVLQKAGGTRKKWWFFLDGFRFLPPGNSARALIQALADSIANDNYRERLRLILVDYDEDLEQVEEDRVAWERVSPGILDEQYLLPHVKRCLNIKSPQLPANQLDAKAKAALVGLPTDGTRLKELRKRIIILSKVP